MGFCRTSCICWLYVRAFVCNTSAVCFDTDIHLVWLHHVLRIPVVQRKKFQYFIARINLWMVVLVVHGSKLFMS